MYCHCHVDFPNLSKNCALFAEAGNVPTIPTKADLLRGPVTYSAKDDPAYTHDDWTGPTAWEKEFIDLYYPGKDRYEDANPGEGVVHFTSYAWLSLGRLRVARDCGYTGA